MVESFSLAYAEAGVDVGNCRVSFRHVGEERTSDGLRMYRYVILQTGKPSHLRKRFESQFDYEPDDQAAFSALFSGLGWIGHAAKESGPFEMMPKWVSEWAADNEAELNRLADETPDDDEHPV